MQHGSTHFKNHQKTVDRLEDEIWISNFDLDYPNDQLRLLKRAKVLCIFAVIGGNFTGYYRFLNDFFGQADILTIFQEKMLENNHPAWLDDLIVTTKCPNQKHMDELIDVLTRFENTGYILSETKSELFETEIN